MTSGLYNTRCVSAHCAVTERQNYYPQCVW